jgi:hypothetical protein
MVNTCGDGKPVSWTGLSIPATAPNYFFFFAAFFFFLAAMKITSHQFSNAISLNLIKT